MPRVSKSQRLHREAIRPQSSARAACLCRHKIVGRKTLPHHENCQNHDQEPGNHWRSNRYSRSLMVCSASRVQAGAFVAAAGKSGRLIRRSLLFSRWWMHPEKSVNARINGSILFTLALNSSLFIPLGVPLTNHRRQLLEDPLQGWNRSGESSDGGDNRGDRHG
jgi:hypothetical protein